MSVQINYKNKINGNFSRNYALFVNDKFQAENIKNIFSKEEITFISEIQRYFYERNVNH